jgi:hypothetical protein
MFLFICHAGLIQNAVVLPLPAAEQTNGGVVLKPDARQVLQSARIRLL